VLAFLFCFCVQGASPAQAANEVVLFHGKVFTGEPEHPYAEAVAIRGDKIVAVGNRGDVSKAVASDAKFIDLKGKFLMPGLIDSHCHAVGGGLLLISAVVGEDMRTVDQLVAFAAEAKKSGRGMHGDILIVSGVPLAFWSKKRMVCLSYRSDFEARRNVCAAQVEVSCCKLREPASAVECIGIREKQRWRWGHERGLDFSPDSK